MTCTSLSRSAIKQTPEPAEPVRLTRFEPVCEVRARHPIMVPSPIGVYVRVETVRTALRAAGVDPGSVGL